jgi:hypothetical protein
VRPLRLPPATAETGAPPPSRHGGCQLLVTAALDPDSRASFAVAVHPVEEDDPATLAVLPRGEAVAVAEGVPFDPPVGDSGDEREPCGHVDEGRHTGNCSGSSQRVFRWRIPAGTPNAHLLGSRQRAPPQQISGPVPYSRVEPGGTVENASPGTIHVLPVFQEAGLVLEQGGLVLSRASSSGLPPASENHQGAQGSHQDCHR